MTDDTLLEQARAGNCQALGQLFSANERACYQLALCLTGNPADAEDVCQEAFSRVVRDLAALGAVANFRSWLLRIIVCAHRDRLDSETARRRRERSFAMQREKVEDRPSSAIEDAELSKQVEVSLSQLREEYRLPIALHYRQGLSHAETGQVLAMPEGTVKANIHRGLEELRQRLAQHGYVCATPPVLAALQEGVAVATPASLSAFVKTLLASGVADQTATAGGGAVAASSSAFPWKMAITVSLAVLLIFGAYPQFKQASPPAGSAGDRAEPKGEQAESKIKAVTIMPRTHDAWEAFRELERQGGPAVVMLAERESLLVPVELRFQAVEGRRLVEAVAAAHHLQLTWAQEGKCAVLSVGASDAEVERVRKDLESREGGVRREAVWRAGWLRDARLVPLLVKSTRDGDAETARQALVGLRRATWSAVLVLDQSAEELLAAEFDSLLWNVRADAASALNRVRGEKALALIEKALSDPNIDVRAISAMGRLAPELAVPLLEKRLYDPQLGQPVMQVLARLGSEQALALLEKVLNDADANVRHRAVFALPEVSGEGALPFIKKALAHADGEVRIWAARALRRPGGQELLTLIEKGLGNADLTARYFATSALGYLGTREALGLIEKALAAPDALVQVGACEALASMGGEQALTLLETELANQDSQLRSAAATALGRIGGPKALRLLEKALTDQDASVRRSAAAAVCNAGGEQALPLIERLLGAQHPHPEDKAVLDMGLVVANVPKAWALVENALNSRDAATRSVGARALRRARGVQALALLEKALASSDDAVRWEALFALKCIGGEQARAMLEKQQSHPRVGTRMRAVGALGGLGGDKALALVMKALSDPSWDVRCEVVHAAGRAGGEKALELVEKALADPDVRVRRAAAATLNTVGGEKALGLIEKALASKDFAVRDGAASALAGLSGERALALMEKALADPDPKLRASAARMLVRGNWSNERELLLKRLAEEKDPEVLSALRDASQPRFGDDPLIQKTLKDLNLPEAPAAPAAKPKAQPDDF